SSSSSCIRNKTVVSRQSSVDSLQSTVLSHLTADCGLPTVDCRLPTALLIASAGPQPYTDLRREAGGHLQVWRPVCGPVAKGIPHMLWKGFQRPKRLEFERETLTDRFGRFYAQPFERGFGTTIGN